MRTLSCTLCLLACITAAVPAHARFDITDYGAIGDGRIDDMAAIDRALHAADAHGGGTVYFPRGDYRCTRASPREHCIELRDVGHVTLRFAPGARLLVDNLDAEGKGDRGHGIHITGRSHDIHIDGAFIAWAVRPSRRSRGDGIRVQGYPSSDRATRRIRIENTVVRRSPQAGIIVMGAEGVDVHRVALIETLADGLHINASRSVRISEVVGVDNGDDTLAFVTYQDASEVGKGPYGLANLGEWNNDDSRATGIVALGGKANGVRVAGSRNVFISDVRVHDKLNGVMIDAGEADGVDHKWTYLASREIHVKNVHVTDCFTGLHVTGFDRDLAKDRTRWWTFDILLENALIEMSKHNAIAVVYAAGVQLSGVRARSGNVLLQSASGLGIDGLAIDAGLLNLSHQPAH